MAETRQIVVPGEVVGSTADLRPGQNTYLVGTSILALRLGVKTVRGDAVNVISVSGRYEPYRGDMVIGTVAETGPSNWYVNIGAANDVGMHVNDVPWRVEFGETSKYLAVGDTVLLKIVHVDEMKKAQVSMKDRQCRKLSGGLILDIQPTKVPRVVGRNGSMITMVKDATNVRLFVGQNGVIWMDGEPEDVQLALEAVRKIEAEAHTTGLTDRMKAWLEERRPTASRPKRDAPPEDDAPAEEAREARPPRERTRERPPPREERPARVEREDRERAAPQSAQREERPVRMEREERPIRREREYRPAPRAEREDRPAPRVEREDRPAPRVEREDRPAPRGEREERPRARETDERPRERAPPPRRDEEESPRERSYRPMRVEDDAPERAPTRRFENEERPVRREPRANDDRPARRPAPRDEEEERPVRRAPPSDDDHEPTPMRRPQSDAGDRPAGDANTASGGGNNRRRGGRGRRGGTGRGRSDRKED